MDGQGRGTRLRTFVLGGLVGASAVIAAAPRVSSLRLPLAFVLLLMVLALNASVDLVARRGRKYQWNS